ncbi:MAG: cupin domain-containing protein [Planctomycetes bacterium]|nr:cupin domain-containing protein [Planctomycetota bacterium]
MASARDWIEQLQLTPHPEGGHYRQTYRATELIEHANLPERFNGARAFSTAIYFLLNGDEFSALHRIRSDEVWHHYDGGALDIHIIDAAGRYLAIPLGKDVTRGERPQAVVPGGDLFGASLRDSASFALVGCTVAPGFDFADFELPPRAELLREYPQHREVIERLTRS